MFEEDNLPNLENMNETLAVIAEDHNLEEPEKKKEEEPEKQKVEGEYQNLRLG